ncbi:methyl-accepting chemotaxis protein, partial [Macromonas nakdongensis]|uniref:methyl-accepting chemotaxis protein n=1 Tax=Macromonas nakdongensis TaxID=1843082 RepID=UPI0026F44E7F
MNLNNWRIGTRLGLAFAVMLLLLAVVVGWSVYEFRALLVGLDRVVQMERRAALTDGWAAHTRLNVNRVLAIAKSRNDPEVEAYFAPQIAETTQRINEVQKTLEAEISSSEGKALLAKVSQLRGSYIAARKTFFEALKAEELDGASRLLSDQLLPAANAYMAAQEELVQLQHRFVDEFSGQARAEVDRAVLIVLGLSVAALLFGVAVAIALGRSITRPLREAGEFADTIAHGDLTRRIAVTRQDEFGTLLRSLAEMQSSLQRVVGQIRQAGDGIGQAAGEIAMGNQDLSGRTEQTASNLEETAASMEQLTATVRQSAEAARQANQLASSAAEVAERGGSVVGQVVHTMNDITQSSQRISDIISVIDGIAFQTNILALNAAVEAARAGEQGRGFAVVAGEVRTLAQRSAQAAKEIKDLINASVSRVQDGSRLVEDAGTTMHEIVGSVQRVSDIIGEITAAAAEQSDGIGQVNVAVNQLDQMT